VNAALTLRQLAPQDQVALVSEEKQPFYSKVVTSYFVAGKAPYENLLLADSGRFQDIDLLLGRRVEAVDGTRKTVTLEGGERIWYDRLLLATGAAPALPAIEGARLPGVFTLWTHDDAVLLKDYIAEGQNALVIRAGLVGLKAAEALLMRGLRVTVVELLDRVLPQVLARKDAGQVEAALRARGLTVQTGTSVIQLSGGGRLRQALLSDGRTVDCDVAVIATGVRPNLRLARSAGAGVGRGILVDEFLRTTVADVYAAGDVAEGWDLARGRRLPNPTWGNASEQGRIAAHNMAGLTKPFTGAVTVNSFTFFDVSMAAVGITQPEGDFFEVRTYTDQKSGDYRKLVMLGDRLVGGIAIGDVGMVGVWRGLIARKEGMASLAAELLSRKTTFVQTHGFI